MELGNNCNYQNVITVADINCGTFLISNCRHRSFRKGPYTHHPIQTAEINTAGFCEKLIEFIDDRFFALLQTSFLLSDSIQMVNDVIESLLSSCNHTRSNVRVIDQILSMPHSQCSFLFVVYDWLHLLN